VNLSVWIIPVVSLIVGGWLIYRYYMNLGPLVLIKFENSGGLEPKKSVVKFRDMKVGVVESVELLKKGVLVSVRMHKDAKPYLNSTTKFWIVKPRIEVGKVSGIEALFSGPYIQMEAKYIGFTKKKFRGYDTPPIELEISGGKIIKLKAKNTYGLSEKMPVYFRGMEVGNIRSVNLKKDGVDIYLSIKKQYATYVNDSTRFWNLRGVDITFNKDNLQFQVPSLSELVVGGVEFNTLDEAPFTKKSFVLYPSRSEAFANRLGGIEYYPAAIKIVDDKNGRLRVGNGVFYKDFRVGYIERLYSKLKGTSVVTVAYIKINDAFGDIKKAIQRGLKATIKNSSIFGGLKIELIFDKNASVGYYENRVLIPFVKKKEEGLIDKLQAFVDKLNSLDIQKSLNLANGFIKNTNISVSKTLKEINSLLIEAQTSLKKVNNLSNNIKTLIKSYDKNSTIYRNINKTLKNTNQMIDIYQKVGKKIDNKPNSLILGD